MPDQTAVEWLKMSYDNLCLELKTTDITMHYFNAQVDKLFEQAKQMEKEQIIKSNEKYPK